MTNKDSSIIGDIEMLVIPVSGDGNHLRVNLDDDRESIGR